MCQILKKKSFLFRMSHMSLTTPCEDISWKKLTLTIAHFHHGALTRLSFVPSAVSTIAFCIIWEFLKIKNLTWFHMRSTPLQPWNGTLNAGLSALTLVSAEFHFNGCNLWLDGKVFDPNWKLTILAKRSWLKCSHYTLSQSILTQIFVKMNNRICFQLKIV